MFMVRLIIINIFLLFFNVSYATEKDSLRSKQTVIDFHVSNKIYGINEIDSGRYKSQYQFTFGFYFSQLSSDKIDISGSLDYTLGNYILKSSYIPISIGNLKIIKNKPIGYLYASFFVNYHFFHFKNLSFSGFCGFSAGVFMMKDSYVGIYGKYNPNYSNGTPLQFNDFSFPCHLGISCNLNIKDKFIFSIKTIGNYDLIRYIENDNVVKISSIYAQFGLGYII